MVTQPKHDWGNDYDIFDEEYVRDPYPIWDELREKCPVAHSDRWGGSWMPTRYEDLFKIAQDISFPGVMLRTNANPDEAAPSDATVAAVPSGATGATTVASR